MPRSLLVDLVRVCALSPCERHRRDLRRRHRADATLKVNERDVTLVETRPTMGSTGTSWSGARSTASLRGRPSRSRPGAGPAGLLRRLEGCAEPDLLAHVPERLPALRRPGAAAPRHGLQGARRDVLGAAGVAAQPPDARLRAVVPTGSAASSCTSRTGAATCRTSSSPATGRYGRARQGLFGRLLYSDRLSTARGRRRRRAGRVVAQRSIDTLRLRLRARLEARYRDRDARSQRRLLLLVRPTSASRGYRVRGPTATASASSTVSSRSGLASRRSCRPHPTAPAFDAAAQAAATRTSSTVLGGDRVCARER